MNGLLDLLRDPVWQGMGVLVALFFSVVQTVRHRNKSALALGVIACLVVAVAMLRPSSGALATAGFAPGEVCGHGEVVRVTLFIRETPSDKASILHTLRSGDRVDLLCRRSAVLGGVTWTEVRFGNTVGWVAEFVVGEPRPHMTRE